MSRQCEDNNPNSQPLDAVEQALAAYRAAPPRIDRDRLMFLAGQASLSPGVHAGSHTTDVSLSPGVHARMRRVDAAAKRWLWPASTAALAATSLALAVALLLLPQPRVEIVYREVPVEVAGENRVAAETLPAEAPLPSLAEVVAESPPYVPPRTGRIPTDNYLRVRDVALRMGLDALGSPRPGGGGSSSAPTYRELLETMVPGSFPAEPMQTNSPEL
jgi:hypothetical protein